MPISVVILAAGQGKRMCSDLPKVLQPLAGKPLLAHVLDRARELEPAAIHIVYGHGAGQVREAFGAHSGIHWCLQAEQLGTGHAVQQAMPNIPDDHDVVVLCGDVPLAPTDILRELAQTLAARELVVLAAQLEDPSGYGRIVRSRSGHVQRIVEEQDASETERRITEINTGLIGAKAKALRRWLGSLGNANTQGEYYLTDIVSLACGEGLEVAALKTEHAASVLGINDKIQLAAAERAYQRGQAENLMRQGVTLADPERIDIRGALRVGRDVFIDVGVVFEGQVELGDGVHIGPNCVLTDTRLGAGCRVHASVIATGVVAGERCELGPFARLRPGAELAARVKVGNFVEIKNSTVAEGSKVNHLSYVGDATVGSGVNVGAGAITCNYDGAGKHRTNIGDGAFIGSGVMLVAPIDVGPGATIGAGSTVSKMAPPNELTLARSRQTTVSGWRRPKKPAK